MLVQAAKIIGSGLATIGLKESLLSPLTNILLSPLQSNNLLTKLSLTHLSIQAIKTIDNMIVSMSRTNQLYKFLEEEHPNSCMYVNVNIENGIRTGNNFVHSLSDCKKSYVKKPAYPFHITGVYAFNTLTNEQYIGSSTNLYTSTNRWIEYQAGKYPLVLIDTVKDTEVVFKGIRTVQRYFHKLLNKKPDYKKVLFINFVFHSYL